MLKPHATVTGKFLSCIGAALSVALAGCNQYSAPVIAPTTATAGTAAPLANGASARSANPLDNQDSPTETTGSVGGTPGGTSSAQTVPSSSDGIR